MMDLEQSKSHTNSYKLSSASICERKVFIQIRPMISPCIDSSTRESSELRILYHSDEKNRCSSDRMVLHIFSRLSALFMGMARTSQYIQTPKDLIPSNVGLSEHFPSPVYLLGKPVRAASRCGKQPCARHCYRTCDCQTRYTIKSK